MDISSIIDAEKNYETEYNAIYREYHDKCNQIIPLEEKYILCKDVNLMNKTYPASTIFTIDVPYTMDIHRIDAVLCIGDDCIVYDTMDCLLADLEGMSFEVDRVALEAKLKVVEEETMKIFKMLAVNDIDLLMQLKEGFKQLNEFSKTADYSVVIKNRS